MIDSNLLTGKSDTHTTPLDPARPNIRVHKLMVSDLLDLMKLAKNEGFDLQVASGFRDYERQKLIWNEKALGKRPLLDDYGMPCKVEFMTPKEIAWAIMRWSAIPGASRHHWGTDIDIYDRAAMPDGYELQLSPAEVTGEGIFSPMHEWLDQMIKHKQAKGFYRPYSIDHKGIHPERWHLSYHPLASDLQLNYSFELFQKVLKESDLELKGLLTKEALPIFELFVKKTTRY